MSEKHKKESKVLELDEYRPSFIFPSTIGALHIIPEHLIISFINGENELHEEVLRQIVKVWFTSGPKNEL